MGIQFENLGLKESVRLQEFLLPLILAAPRSKHPDSPIGALGCGQKTIS